MPFAWVGAAAGLAGVANTVGGMVDGGSSSGGGQPAGNTTQTTTQVPWSGQSPYLSQGFQGAANLYQNYTPQYYPGQQIADFTGAQNQGLQGIQNLVNAGDRTAATANDYIRQLQGGQYLNGNPASNNLSAMATGQFRNPALDSTQSGINQSNASMLQIANNPNGGNQGNNLLSSWASGKALNNPGTSYLSPWASGQSLNNPGTSYLSPWASGQSLNNPGTAYLSPWASGQSLNNPGNSYLQGLASGGASKNNPAAGELSYLSSGASTANLPGQDTLGYFASGSMLGADNPYWKNLTDSLSSSVTPGIQAQFAKGNNMSNPSAAFASSQGLAAALAPYMEQNYTTGQSNMLGAANTLGSQGLQGLQLRQGAAGTLGNQYLSGQQLAGTAGQNIAQNYLTGAGQAQSAGQNIAQNYLTGAGQSQQAGQNIAQNYLTGAGQAQQAGQNIAQNYLTGANTTAGAAQNLAANQYVGQGQGLQAAQGIGANALNQGTLFNNAFNSGQTNQINANSILGQNYQGTLNNMTNSLAQSPAIGQMPYQDFQNLYQAGSQQQNQQQQQINAMMQQWNWLQQRPYNQLNQFMNTVGGAQYGGQTTQTTPYFQNSYANNAANLAGLGNSVNGLSNAYNSIFGGPSQVSTNSPYSLISSPSSGSYTPSTVAPSVPYYQGP